MGYLKLKGRMDKNIIFVLFCILLLSCNRDEPAGVAQKANNIDTTIKIKKRAVHILKLPNPRHQEYFSYTGGIRLGDYSVEVETYCIDDSLTEYQPIPFFQYPVVIDQKVIFKKNDTILNSFWVYEQGKFKVSTKKHNTQYSPCLLIYSINFIEGTKSDVFFIDYVGLTHPRDEYYSIHSLDGQFLYGCYHCDFLKKSFEKGNREEVVKNYGLGIESYIVQDGIDIHPNLISFDKNRILED